MQDVDMEPASPPKIEPAHPAVEGLYPAIEKVEKAAIKAIEEAKKESTVLSYRMLIVGAMLGVLGNFFIAALLRWYDADWVVDFNNGDFLLSILSTIAFFVGSFIVFYSLNKVNISYKNHLKK